MGMYTELHFNSELRSDTPEAVLVLLRSMLDFETTPPEELPDHPLFATARWSGMLRCDSYYFDADTHSTLRWDKTADAHYLCIRCNLKNYDGEIEHFVNWVTPYLAKEAGEFLGFQRYEEDDTPRLLHMATSGREQPHG